jgi:hypothetical protein
MSDRQMDKEAGPATTIQGVAGNSSLTTESMMEVDDTNLEEAGKEENQEKRLGNFHWDAEEYNYICRTFNSL